MSDNLEFELSTQVLVIGSGAGGAIAAATLAEAGYSVLIVEEGPQVNTDEMSTHSPRAMQLLYRNGGLTPILGNTNIALVEGCCVGGSTEINSAFWVRTPHNVIERWCNRYKIHNLNSDIYFSLFSEIESEVGVVSLNSNKPPMSSLLLKRGAEKLKWCVKEVPRAQRTDLGKSQFAPGAKNSMSRTYIPKALQAGARLLSNCRITRLHHKQGQVDNIYGVIRTARGTRNLSIRADTVFVCGGAIQTPVLLRSSGIKRNIGDNLRIHPMLKVAALFNDKIDSHQAPLPIYQIKEFWPEITLGGSVFTPGYLALTLSENWLENQAVIERNWRRMALYYAASRSSNRGTVRVFPFTNEAIVRYSLSKRDQISLSVGLAHLGEALFAAGAKKIFPALRSPRVLNSIDECRTFLNKPIPISDMSLTTVHVFSSCPMGENRDLCATDSSGKVHGFENLYIADASLIPDSPGVNPQATVMALVLRNVRRFIKGGF